MKKYKYILLFSCLGLLFAGTLGLLIAKSRKPETVYPLETAVRRTIRDTIIASGSIVPQKEIDVKSSLSGVVDEIFVNPGDKAEKGDKLLSIRVVPNSLDLNATEAALDKAQIRLDSAKIQMDRQKKQYEAHGIAEITYNETVNAYKLALVEYEEIKNRMLLIQDGISAGNKEISNIVSAPISGTILDIPVKEGAPVQENSGMSAGTTVAVLADMSSLYFKGEIDETEVGELEKGMPVKITVAALDTAQIDGTLSFISPRGYKNNGSVMFPIEIDFKEGSGIQLRAGYSASAEIILDAADNVVSLPERDLIYDNGKAYVEIQRKEQQFDKIEVVTGISDGINTEILKGLNEGDTVKARS